MSSRRRTEFEESITLSSYIMGINLMGFGSPASDIAPSSPPPPLETFFFVMQNGSRYLTQLGDRYLKNG